MRTFIYSVAARQPWRWPASPRRSPRDTSSSRTTMQRESASTIRRRRRRSAATPARRSASSASTCSICSSIWEGVLQPQVDILVHAQFTPLGANVLGSAGPTFIFDNFPGAEYPNMWYHSALADHLAGDDLEPGLRRTSSRTSRANFHSISASTITKARWSTCCRWCCTSSATAWASRTSSTRPTGAAGRRRGGHLLAVHARRDHGKIWNAMTDAERAASAINVRKVSWNGLNVNKDVPKVLELGEPFVPQQHGGRPVADDRPGLFRPAADGRRHHGDVVVGLDAADCGTGPSTTDACSPLTNDLTGKIALVDRGTCGFIVKVKNAQNAGAIAVLVADNAPGSPPAGLGGDDPTITIPSGTHPAGRRQRDQGGAGHAERQRDDRAGHVDPRRHRSRQGPGDGRGVDPVAAGLVDLALGYGRDPEPVDGAVDQRRPDRVGDAAGRPDVFADDGHRLVLGR